MNNPLEELGDEKAISKDGYEFDPSSLVWVLSPDDTVYLYRVYGLITIDLFKSVAKVCLFYAENYASATTVMYMESLKNYFNFVFNKRGLVDSINEEDVIDFRSSLGPRDEFVLARVRVFLRQWWKLGYNGVNKRIINLLDNFRLEGNKKGEAVQCRDPHRGPLSSMEFEALRQKMVEAFENGELELEKYTLLELFLTTGRRPVQIADLKISDLVEAQAQDGLKEFILKVPRRKQTGASWREETKPFALQNEIGSAVSALCNYNRSEFRKIAGNKVEGKLENLPVFPDWRAIREASDTTSGSWRELLEGQSFRRSRQSISGQVKRIVDSLDVPSERTGDRLDIFPTRLRRTLADRAAHEGYGEMVIAELLDHSDNQQVKVYTENGSENVHAINQAMAQQLAPLAQAFAGVIVGDEKEALRGDDPTSRVRSEDGSVGTCGHYSFCGAFGPIACYTCQHFQPWVDGPHEQVLEGLWKERDRIKEATGDETMAAVNDRTIVAVTEVVQRCQARLSDLSEGDTSGE